MNPNRQLNSPSLGRRAQWNCWVITSNNQFSEYLEKRLLDDCEALFETERFESTVPALGSLESVGVTPDLLILDLSEPEGFSFKGVDQLFEFDFDLNLVAIIREGDKYTRKRVMESGAAECVCHEDTSSRLFCKLLAQVCARKRFPSGTTTGRAGSRSLDLADQATGTPGEERLRLPADSAQVGLWNWDVDTDKVSFSRWWNEILGYSPQELGNGIDSWKSLLHPDDRTRFESSLAKALSDRKTEVYSEFRLKHKEGHYLRFVTVGKQTLDPDNGTSICFTGNTRDVSKKRRVEREVARSFQKLRDITWLLDNAASVSRTDADGTIIQVNANFCTTSGYTEEELLGQNHRILKSGTHPDAFFSELWSTISAGEIWRGEICNRDREGKFLWLDSTIGACTDNTGKIVGYLSIHFDVTGRKTAELDVRDSKRFLERVVENLPLHLFVKDAENLTFLRWNRMAEKHTGLRAKEVLGKTDFDLFEKSEAEAFREVDRSVLDSKTLDVREEELSIREQGVMIHRTTKIPILDEKGKPQYLLGVSEDVTKEKRAEKELEETHNELMKSSRMAGMAEVASNVLHNVGNVLNSVNISANILDSKVQSIRTESLFRIVAMFELQKKDLPRFFNDEEKAKQVPLFIDRFAQYLEERKMELINEIKSVLKYIGHIKQIVFMQQKYAGISGLSEEVSPKGILNDMLELNSLLASRHSLELLVEAEETRPIVTDKNKVLQILVNGLRNAKHACDESGKTEKRITVGLKEIGDEIIFTIKDNGAGIAPQNRNKIFSYGFTTRKEGHGFGLHGAANAAKDLKGRLSLESEGEGRGATFVLALPIQESGNPKHGSPSPDAANY